MNEPRYWSWRDAGNHGPAIRALNLAAAATGLARRRFDPEQLMEKAVRRTGLDDFGEPSFREGLEIVCRSYSEDAQMTGLGQIAGRQMIVGALAKRLQVIDWGNRHPATADEVIAAPWVITGLVRSGTTLASALIDLDARVRSPLVWEVDFPIPPAGLAMRVCDPRIAESARQLDRFHKLIPPMKVIHPLEAGYPQECVVITQLDFHSIMFQAISLAPEYMQWYSHSDKHAAYRLHKRLLQIWQAAIPTERWASKAPNHMHGIDAFMDTYPDARMIWSHRDPLVCVPSVASLTLSFTRTHNPRVDPRVAGKLINEHWLAGIRNMMDYDKTRPDRDWCHHLYYDDLVADPVRALGAAYRHFGDEIGPLHRRKINTWVRERPKNTFGVHRYTLEEFGLDADEMREQYAEYMQRYDVPMEHHRG